MATPALAPTTKEALGTKEQFRNVLFATDFSEGSLRALPYVAGIGKAFGATVHLCHIISATTMAAAAAAPALYQATGKEATEHLAGLLHSPVLEGLERKLVLAEGPVEEELLKTIRERNIDLIVAGTHGRTGWRKLLLGSVVEAICRAATCPLLTVGPALAVHDGVPFRRILFPTDLSKESMSVVPYLTLLSKKYGSQVSVLHVIPEETGTNPDARALSEPIRENMMLYLERELASSTPEFMTEFGDTVNTVLRVAQKKNADLIAMGIRNAFLPGIQLRSTTAYRIIAGASSPVFTLRDIQTL
jgi:nucleotide-binding universal stress UspA family protein